MLFDLVYLSPEANSLLLGGMGDCSSGMMTWSGHQVTREPDITPQEIMAGHSSAEVSWGIDTGSSEFKQKKSIFNSIRSLVTSRPLGT